MALRKGTNGEWQLSARIDFTVDDIDEYVTGLMSWKTSPKDGGDVFVVMPLRDYNSTYTVYDYDSLGASCGH